MKCVLSIIASAAILAFASPALAAGPSIPFDATEYQQYGILLFPCDLNAYATTCELDTGDGVGVAIGAADANGAGIVPGGLLSIYGATGNGTDPTVAGALAIPASGSTTERFSGVEIPGWTWKAAVGTALFTGVVGPIFAVDAKTDAIFATGRETRIYRPITFRFVAGGYIDFPCVVGAASFPDCELDTGSPHGILMSPSEAEAAGIPLGAADAQQGVTGYGAAYDVTATVAADGQAPVTVAGTVIESYTGIPVVGAPFLAAEYPGGYVVNATDGVISALLSGAR